MLKRGGVVVFPTETAYALGADARNEKAVERVRAIKGREAGKSLPLIAASREMVERFAGIPRALERLAREHWPGALTLVLPVLRVANANRYEYANRKLPLVYSHRFALAPPLEYSYRFALAMLAPGVVRDGTVAVRVSSHPVARALSEGLGAPLVSTSANRAGGDECFSVSCVREQVGDTPDYFLDTGELAPQPPSTIVALDDYGYPEVLRQGGVKI